jgi:hypothetical protein
MQTGTAEAIKTITAEAGDGRQARLHAPDPPICAFAERL